MYIYKFAPMKSKQKSHAVPSSASDFWIQRNLDNMSEFGGPDTWMYAYNIYIYVHWHVLIDAYSKYILIDMTYGVHVPTDFILKHTMMLGFKRTDFCTIYERNHS